jgi:NDP-4-keto-2,6-dideoxyhexose 3-C-methyltransferase
MKITEIKKCRICGNEKLIEIMNLGEQELSGKFPKIDEVDPPSSPLILVKCDDSKKEDACGLIQLKHSSEPEQMYVGGYGYLSGMNQTMTAHLKDVVKKIESIVNLKSGDLVIDIGSNDGTLLKSYTKSGIKRVGIDPGGQQYKQYYPPEIGLITDFFPTTALNNLYPGQKAKVITSIAMFYDLENPMSFVQNIKKYLDTEGIWVLEQSYLPSMLESNAFDTICHEHLEYYALKQIEWMLKRNDLKVIDVERNLINGGSFKIYVAHKGTIYPINKKSISDLKDYENSLYLNTITPYKEFKNRVDKIKIDLTTFIKNEKVKGKLIYAYGASTKGNILLNYFKLDNTIITAAAERNDKKWGCRTPGTHIPIVSEESARKAFPEYFLVLPWHFKDEFIQRESTYLKEGGKFIFPLPSISVISWNDIKNLVKS